MNELWLRYRDGDGEKRVEIDRSFFTVGRHSDADLAIADGRLSREHLKIQRIGELFLASDAGSSNGTTLNGEPLTEAKEIRHDDVLMLGGFEVFIETSDGIAGSADHVDDADEPESPPAPAANVSAPAAAAPSGGIPTSVFILAPLLGILILGVLAGFIYFFGGSKTEVAGSNEFIYSDDVDDDDKPRTNKKDAKDDDDPLPGNKTSTPAPVNSTVPGGTSVGTTDPADPKSSGDQDGISTTTSTQNQTDTGRIEQNGAAFLRRIAQNDPRAFLTSEQANKVSGKVKQYSKSSALADNLNSARKNAAQIKTLAVSKNLKPQFLAIAAVSKLGNGRGDVVQTAQGIAEVFDKLGTQIGNELAEDALLMVAAYDQGTAGDFMKMRNMLQDLSNKSPESARAIRTIWFLQKNAKITQAEFDSSLNFLAIGTISQNPKDFGVNAEPLVL